MDVCQLPGFGRLCSLYEETYQGDWIQRLGFNVLQQLAFYPCFVCLFPHHRRLGSCLFLPQFVRSFFFHNLPSLFKLTHIYFYSPEEGRTFLLSAIAFSGAAAVFISYSTAWCVRICGATTYSLVGALNKLPVAASGILFFGDPMNFGNVSAILVGGVSGIVYAVAKTNQAKVEKAKQAKGGDSKA